MTRAEFEHMCFGIEFANPADAVFFDRVAFDVPPGLLGLPDYAGDESLTASGVITGVDVERGVITVTYGCKDGG